MSAKNCNVGEGREQKTFEKFHRKRIRVHPERFEKNGNFVRNPPPASSVEEGKAHGIVRD